MTDEYIKILRPQWASATFIQTNTNEMYKIQSSGNTPILNQIVKIIEKKDPHYILAIDKTGNYICTLSNEYQDNLGPITEISTFDEWIKQFNNNEDIEELFNIINDSEKLLKNG